MVKPVSIQKKTLDAGPSLLQTRVQQKSLQTLATTTELRTANFFRSSCRRRRKTKKRLLLLSTSSTSQRVEESLRHQIQLALLTVEELKVDNTHQSTFTRFENIIERRMKRLITRTQVWHLETTVTHSASRSENSIMRSYERTSYTRRRSRMTLGNTKALITMKTLWVQILCHLATQVSCHPLHTVFEASPKHFHTSSLLVSIHRCLVNLRLDLTGLVPKGWILWEEQGGTQVPLGRTDVAIPADFLDPRTRA